MEKRFRLLLPVLAVLSVACNGENTGYAPAPPPVITDLSHELEESLRSEVIRFKVDVPDCDRAGLYVSGPSCIYEGKLVPGKENVVEVDELLPSSEYLVRAYANRSNISSSYEIMISTAAAKYLTLTGVTADSYSFRVRSSSEGGFWFSSGEYAALDYLLPGWDVSDQASLKELLMMLYPFEGSGDMTVKCIDGETPEWAEIPVEVLPDTRYFIMAADKDASGNIVGDVHFLDFNTLK